MVHLYYIPCLRYTILFLVGNPQNVKGVLLCIWELVQIIYLDNMCDTAATFFLLGSLALLTQIDWFLKLCLLYISVTRVHQYTPYYFCYIQKVFVSSFVLVTIGIFKVLFCGKQYNFQV